MNGRPQIARSLREANLHERFACIVGWEDVDIRRQKPEPDTCPNATLCRGAITPQQQWDGFNAFIEQDKYLRSHRGQIAERFGGLNPWYHNLDLRLLQDFGFGAGASHHAFQLSLDILNLTNLINSSWGVRKVASAAATSPLTFTSAFDGQGRPIFNFTGPARTFVDDPGPLSRWRAQIWLRYLFN